MKPRLWIAGGIQYDTGLPFEFDGDPDTVLAEYGQQVLDRINFASGRIYPSFQVNASAGADIYRSDRLNMRLQADGQNLTNVLDVIDFGGLFSGNAIGPHAAMLSASLPISRICIPENQVDLRYHQPYLDHVTDLMRLSLNIRQYRYNERRRATVPHAADLKRKRADELNESVSARCLWLRRTVPT